MAEKLGHPSQYPLERLLVERYPFPEWATIVEFSGGVGCSGYDQRADVVAFNCWPSKGFHRLAFEIKRSRSDYMREVDTPGKRAWLEKHFHQCYFVVIPGIVKPDEIPEGWGLLVATQDGEKLIRRKAAMHREIPPLPEPVALSAIRTLANTLHTDRTKRYTFENENITTTDLEAKVKALTGREEQRLEKEWHAVRKLRQRLRERKQELEGPMQALATAAGEFSTFSDWAKDPAAVTAHDVARYIDTIRVQAVRRVMRQVFGAHEALGALIKAVKESGLEHGEVPLASYIKSHPLG